MSNKQITAAPTRKANTPKLTRLSSVAPKTLGMTSGERFAYAFATVLGITPSPEAVARVSKDLCGKWNLSDEQIEGLMSECHIGYGRIEDLPDYETNPHFRQHRERKAAQARLDMERAVAGSNPETRPLLQRSLPLLRKLAAKGCTLTPAAEA